LVTQAETHRGESIKTSKLSVLGIEGFPVAVDRDRAFWVGGRHDAQLEDEAEGMRVVVTTEGKWHSAKRRLVGAISEELVTLRYGYPVGDAGRMEDVEHRATNNLIQPFKGSGMDMLFQGRFTNTRRADNSGKPSIRTGNFAACI